MMDMKTRRTRMQAGRPLHGDRPKTHITARIDADLLEQFDQLEGRNRSAKIEQAMIRLLNRHNDHERAERLKMQNAALLREIDDLRRQLSRSQKMNRL